MSLRNQVFGVLVFGMSLVSSALFAGEVADLGRIVVTPYRYEEGMNKVAASVSVITSQDIANANARSVVDALRAVSGLAVRDYYGNGTKVTLDMAGFGEQAALNVLVLVDGRRVNDVDLSGVDWTQVPLDQVERIEVIRGGGAAVLYGDNASSGVVNIVTKKGGRTSRVEWTTAYGSYDQNAQKLLVRGGGADALSYRFSGGRESTHGYRQNTFSKSEDFSSRLDYKLTDSASVHFDTGFQGAQYGLPSALWQTHMDQYGRRYARYPKDHVKNTDRYFVLGGENAWEGGGKAETDVSYRRKDTISLFLSSGNPTRKNRIETLGFTPKYTIARDILGKENRLVAGVDVYRVFYNSDNYTVAGDVLNNYTNINKTSVAGYLQDQFSLTQELSAVGGYRREATRYGFNYHDTTGANPDQDTRIRPRMEAFNGGLVYTYAKDSSVFCDASRSFRFPEVDEFSYVDSFWVQQLDTTLRPQSSVNYQLGVRHAFSDAFKAAGSVYRMNVRDELYLNYLYDAFGSKNENYDKTVHQGLEVSAEGRLSPWLESFGSYTFTDAYFAGGAYNRNQIPAVSRHKVSLGLRAMVAKGVAFSVIDTYVGSSYALNDQSNAHGRVNGYVVADANVAWDLRTWKVVVGVNNLFNKKYSQFAGYDRWSDDRFYYPSPERNYSFKAIYAF